MRLSARSPRLAARSPNPLFIDPITTAPWAAAAGLARIELDREIATSPTAAILAEASIRGLSGVGCYRDEDLPTSCSSMCSTRPTCTPDTVTGDAPLEAAYVRKTTRTSCRLPIERPLSHIVPITKVTTAMMTMFRRSLPVHRHSMRAQAAK